MMLAFSVNASANEESREFSIINAADGLADNSAQYIVCTKTGRMIISTIGNVNFYDTSHISICCQTIVETIACILTISTIFGLKALTLLPVWT